MKRAKVIVHMYISIDGKIDGEFGAQAGAEPSGNFYDNEIFKMSRANANGIVTVRRYAATGNIDFSQYDGSSLTYDDWTPDHFEADTYDISFDRYEKAGWEQNHFDYAGKQSRVIEVLTQQASKNYLAFLRSMEIPYIVCGNEGLDLQEALVKLKNNFHLDTIALCGGAGINGAFLRAGLVDEISLVVAPYVSGDNGALAAFNTLGHFVGDKYEFQSAKKLSDGGVHLIFTKKQEQ